MTSVLDDGQNGTLDDGQGAPLTSDQGGDTVGSGSSTGDGSMAGSRNDADGSAVVIYMPFDTDFSDTKGHTVSANSTCSIVSSPAKFGSGSASIQEDSNFNQGLINVQVSDGALDFEAGDFEIELWLYVPVTVDRTGDIIEMLASGTQSGQTISLTINTSGELSAFVTPQGSYNAQYSLDGGTTKPEDWNYITLSRSGDTLYLALNGVPVSTAMSPGIAFTNPPAMRILNYSHGFFYDDVRVLKGKSIQKGTVTTPPTTSAAQSPGSPASTSGSLPKDTDAAPIASAKGGTSASASGALPKATDGSPKASAGGGVMGSASGSVSHDTVSSPQGTSSSQSPSQSPSKVPHQGTSSSQIDPPVTSQPYIFLVKREAVEGFIDGIFGMLLCLEMDQDTTDDAVISTADDIFQSMNPLIRTPYFDAVDHLCSAVSGEMSQPFDYLILQDIRFASGPLSGDNVRSANIP